MLPMTAGYCRSNFTLKLFRASVPASCTLKAMARARLLHKLKAEFKSPGPNVAFILADEKFPALEIGAALHDVYNATALQAANWLRAAGMGIVDIGQILKN